MFPSHLPTPVILSLVLAGCQFLSTEPADEGGTRLLPRADDTGPGAPGEVATNAGVFLDAPVEGLTWQSEAGTGLTGAGGDFSWVEGDTVLFSVGNLVLGESLGQHTVTPLDLVPGHDGSDVEVLNRARVLLSLDRNGDGRDAITITEEVRAIVDEVLDARRSAEVDWADDGDVEDFIDEVVAAAQGLDGHQLRVVPAEEAAEHLARSLRAAGQWRTNISATPALVTDKAKVDSMPFYVPARRADGTRLTGRAADELGAGGLVKPTVVTYLEEVSEGGASDVFVAVSLDDGQSFRPFDLSQSARRSSISLSSGEPAMGTVGKPNLKIQDNLMLVTWTSKYCPDDDPQGLRDTQDPYGVAGEQGLVSYDEPDLPEEAAYSCLWATRGWIDEQGIITFTRAEQLTSGVRDAFQDFSAAQKNVGFALTWQEDPAGLRPGEGCGPGDGGGGASTNHETDIWYSHLAWSDFATLDADYDADDDPLRQLEADGSPRPKPAIAMASPVRISDNAACRWTTDGWIGEAYCADVCVQADDSGACLTSDGRVLSGASGASRPNLFLVSKSITGEDGTTTTSAQALLAYEETKGGGGDGGPGTPGGGDTGGCEALPPPEAPDSVERGKTIVFHSFQYDQPGAVSGGTIMSDPELNGRRVRMVVQPSSAAGEGDVRALMLYREGLRGEGGNADIMLRIARGGVSAEHFEAPRNLSSPTLLATERGTLRHGPASSERAVDWVWTEADLDTDWAHNPLDNARAHRAILRGDFVAVGYVWAADWATAEAGGAPYDFYVRRSFDGGLSWTDAAGAFEAPRNLSSLGDSGWTVSEPRLVATPGSITMSDGTRAEHDTQDTAVFLVAYGTEDIATGAPGDIFYGRTVDQGETYGLVSWTSPDGQPRDGLDWLAQGPADQGACQLRTEPDGSRLYATWVEASTVDGALHSDTWLRVLDLD